MCKKIILIAVATVLLTSAQNPIAQERRPDRETPGLAEFAERQAATWRDLAEQAKNVEAKWAEQAERAANEADKWADRAETEWSRMRESPQREAAQRREQPERKEIARAERGAKENPERGDQVPAPRFHGDKFTPARDPAGREPKAEQGKGKPPIRMEGAARPVYPMAQLRISLMRQKFERWLDALVQAYRQDNKEEMGRLIQQIQQLRQQRQEQMQAFRQRWQRFSQESPVETARPGLFPGAQGRWGRAPELGAMDRPGRDFGRGGMGQPGPAPQIEAPPIIQQPGPPSPPPAPQLNRSEPMPDVPK